MLQTKDPMFPLSHNLGEAFPMSAFTCLPKSSYHHGCPLPGSVQGQAGWGFEQPGLVGGVPAHGGGVGTR